MHLKHILCYLLLLVLPIGKLWAQPKSNGYLYIQGDKITPFYVKINGKMQARYGKNYCIAPGLSAGEVTVNILFQQNVDSPQTYKLQMPENGYRGFLLSKQNNEYALYDLDEKNYIKPEKKKEK